MSTRGIQLNTTEFRLKHDNDLKQLATFRRVTNYLAAAQLYLKDNFLLREPLTLDHIKERLLGHWGTCPGINLVYSHCNYLIRKHQLDSFLVVGPGHGAPAVLANLYVEGSLREFYPDYTNDIHGLGRLIKGFSWPNGFPSHINAQVPGVINEGGELGYALATSYGAVMDNPNLLVTCLVGDGESETGPTATAWHSIKYIDPKQDGAVLPIIHLNGWRISARTIYGCMSDEELINLFSGFSFQVRIVDDMNDIDADLGASMEWALGQIKMIQDAARSGKPIFKPKWPMLILRTPKGWTGVKTLHGEQIEGTYRSHGIPVTTVSKDKESFDAVQQWLSSYRINELVDGNGKLKKEVTVSLPDPTLRMGRNPHTRPAFEPLALPNVSEFACNLKDDRDRGREVASITELGGNYFADVVKRNPHRFRIFSPDELTSNKLQGVLTVTNRNFQWDEATANKGGQVLEILSEHTCQGWMQGYCLTGRFSLFPSYETFLGIITTMTIQYGKFLKLAKSTSWRTKVPSLNYIETSTLWRQEHNGYSHQNPMFINNLINLKLDMIRIYFPPDANSFLYIMERCLSSSNQINLIVGSKQKMPVWFSAEEAKRNVISGVSIWKHCSTDNGTNPDIILVGCGNETNNEVIAAASILRKDCPELRVRVVNVIDLMTLALDSGHPHQLSHTEYETIFTKDKPVIFNFHGYPSVIRQLLFGRNNSDKMQVFGYIEEGTTTTPFKMLTANKCSRFHLCIAALEAVAMQKEEVGMNARCLIATYKQILKEHEEFIIKYGKDPSFVEKISDAYYPATPSVHA